jgi:predicted DNA-binding transcriptional regulator AlpA
MPTEHLLTPAETAARLRLAKQTLARWRCEGDGPRFVRLSGNRVAYRLCDVEDWLTHRIVRSTSERNAG